MFASAAKMYIFTVLKEQLAVALKKFQSYCSVMGQAEKHRFSQAPFHLYPKGVFVVPNTEIAVVSGITWINFWILNMLHNVWHW